MIIEKIETVEFIEMTTVDGSVYRRYSENNWYKFVYDKEIMLSTAVEEELEQIYQEQILTNSHVNE